jgi:dTDP-4-dehydrorhamnose 3,5-epimerase
MVASMHVLPTTIPGCYELRPQILTDERGQFVKTFSADEFAQAGLDLHFAEEYYTVSRAGVLRGLHFQTPPMEYTKLVYCIAGSVIDAVVDLRIGSPTYCRAATLELSSELGNVLYVPKGLAHGFYVPKGEATLVYNVSAVYSREHDCGILWNSAGICWPTADPITSARDRNFPRLAEFRSPFVYGN